MKKISYYICKYWYAYAFGLVCMVIQVSLDMISPQITKSIIDDVIGNGQIDLLPTLLLLIGGIGLGRAIGGYCKEFTFDSVGARVGVDMRKRLFSHIQGLSVNYFDKTNTGEVMARVKDDIDRVQNSVGYIGMLVIEVTIHMCFVMVSMFRLNSRLFIIPALSVPICGVVAILLESKLNKVFERISEENAEMNTVAQENLAGVRTVKAFARERYEIGKFLKHNRKYYELNMQQQKLWIRFYPVFQAATKFLPLITMLIGGFMVIGDEITLGTLGAFIEYCGYVVWPMEMLGWLANEFAAAFASNKKLKKIYEETPVITEPENPTALEEVAGHITFDNVTLELGDKTVLSDISFDLAAGKTIGIMGATGTGKTSIINLLMRFYDVSNGSIKLDNVDIRELSLAQLRSSVAVVMQDVFLFSDTIGENVKLGKKDLVQDDEVTTALKNACALSFIEKMEDGCDTIIGERGVGLSGGQKQRISIARALAKQTPILVLDDSTSALDMETEHEIQKTLGEYGGITKIIIAHRISAIRNADEIIILEDGHVSERGTHEDLLEHKGYYYKTFMAQYGEFLQETA